MKRIVCAYIVILLFVTGCRLIPWAPAPKSINIDETQFEILSANTSNSHRYIYRGQEFDLVTNSEMSSWSEKNLSFINDRLVVYISWDGFTYYDLAEKNLVREVRTREVERSTYGVCKNTDGDLYILSNSVLYEYRFAEDAFIPLHTFEEDWEPFLYSKMAYCMERNSIFYTVKVDEVFQINELNLETYHIDYRFPGLIPRYVDGEKRLYSVSADQKAIQYVSLDNVDSFEVNTLWSNNAEIFDLSVIDQNMIWLIHHSEKADFWGNKFLLSGLLINQELCKPVSKLDIDYFSIVDFRLCTAAEQ